jgi:hypothetical protein
MFKWLVEIEARKINVRVVVSYADVLRVVMSGATYTPKS